MRAIRAAATAITAAVVAVLAAGCAGRAHPFATGPAGNTTAGGTTAAGATGSTGGGGATAASAAHPSLTVRLGFVPGPLQAPALVGIGEGLFAASLAPRAAVRPIPFPSSAAEAAALAAGKLDAAYISPAAILALARGPHPTPVKIISGAASGGAELIVTPAITRPTQLASTTLAVPSAGSSQDIALRSWLQAQHLPATGPHAVTITTASPATTIQAFKAKRIDGAWEPAPYDIEMTNAGGRALVDEASLWPGGQFAAANLVVTQKFLNHHSAAVLGLLKAQVQASSYLHHNLPQAMAAITAELARLHHSLPAPVLAASLAQITYTSDPIAASLTTQAQHAAAIGLPQPAASLTGLYDLAPLDLILRATGQPPVTP